MRRMLDPKTLGGGGGGGGGPARHAYRIIEKSSFWYISYTSKDYDQFKIGKMMDVPDILSNDEYKELLSIGRHNAGGIISDSGYDYIVIWFRIDRKNDLGYYDCTLSGYRLQENTQTTITYKLRSASSIKVVKLF